METALKVHFYIHNHCQYLLKSKLAWFKKIPRTKQNPQNFSFKAEGMCGGVELQIKAVAGQLTPGADSALLAARGKPERVRGTSSPTSLAAEQAARLWPFPGCAPPGTNLT